MILNGLYFGLILEDFSTVTIICDIGASNTKIFV